MISETEIFFFQDEKASRVLQSSKNIPLINQFQKLGETIRKVLSESFAEEVKNDKAWMSD